MVIERGENLQMKVRNLGCITLFRVNLFIVKVGDIRIPHSPVNEARNNADNILQGR